MLLLVSLTQTLSQPWTWWFSGAAIAVVLLFANILGKKFGISTSFENACTLAGAGRFSSFFKTDLKDSFWRFAFAGGIMLGGFIAANFLQADLPIQIAQSTVSELAAMGFEYPTSIAEGDGIVATNVFNLSNPLGIIMAIVGGFLVGFGARYAKGCTSGHAITGLAHFQLPSLLTVIGFFIGGLLMTHFIMPLIFG